MTDSLRPYAAAAWTYIKAGWPGAIPIGWSREERRWLSRRKAAPPAGFTGWAGVNPSGADVQTWIDGPEGDCNIGLHLHADVYVLDVDAHSSKPAVEALAGLIEQCGRLPATWTNTARGSDAASRHHFFRAKLPEGRVWVDHPESTPEALSGLDALHTGHRYPVVWPSVHPDGATYLWYDPTGETYEGVPEPGWLVDLPEIWMLALSKFGEPLEGSAAGTAQTLDIINHFRRDEPCPPVAQLLANELSRITAASDGGALHHPGPLYALAAYGVEGHAGVRGALSRHQAAYTDARIQLRGEANASASADWWRMICGAIGKKLTATGGAVAEQCDCNETVSSAAATENKRRKLILTPASSFKPARVRWGWAKRMPIGELTLVPGREGIGKSLFLAWMAAQLTRGMLPGEFEGTPRAVLYAASEDSWRYTIAPRMLAAGADLDLVYRITVETPDTDTGTRLVLPVDCVLIPEVAVKVKAAALMLDPIVSLVDERLSVNQSRELRRALEPLRDAAERAEIIIPALVHFNKAVDTDVLSKIPGGRAWAEVARAAFALAADAEASRYVASQIKNNLGQLDQPHLTYLIDEEFIDTDDGQASVGRLRWTGETDVGVDEVLARRPERPGRDVSETTARVVAYVNQLPCAMPIAETAKHFPEIKPNSLRQLLRRAAQAGLVSYPVSGHYGPI